MQPEDMSSRGAPAGLGGESAFLDPCQDAIATLYTYLDGELTKERRHEIKRHLDDCGPCFQAFGFEADVKALIASKRHDDVPDSLRRRVAEAIGAEDTKS